MEKLFRGHLSPRVGREAPTTQERVVGVFSFIEAFMEEPYNRIYCMDATQESAQNWLRLQGYKQKKAHLVNVQTEARRFGWALSRIAEALTKTPTAQEIRVTDDGVHLGRFGLASARNIRFAEVDWNHLKAILTDVEQSETELSTLREELAATGIDVKKSLDSI